MAPFSRFENSVPISSKNSGNAKGNLNCGGTSSGVTTANLKDQATFTGAGRDFVNTWQITSGNYPTLR